MHTTGSSGSSGVPGNQGIGGSIGGVGSGARSTAAAATDPLTDRYADRNADVTLAAPQRLSGMRVSWSGIFVGVLVGLGTLLLLTTLGIAIGVSAVDPSNPDAGAVSTAAGIRTRVSMLLALFAGGWASTRLSMLWDRTAALFEGSLVWVLSMLLILYLATSGIGLVWSGASTLLGGAARGVTAAAQSIDLQELSSGNVDQVLARLNDPRTAGQIASVIGQPREEVAGTLRDIAKRVQAARNDPAQVATEVRQGVQPLLDRGQQRLAQAAEDAQPQVSAAAWIHWVRWCCRCL